MLRSLGLFKMLRIIYQIGLDVVPCWFIFTRKNTKVRSFCTITQLMGTRVR